MGQVIGWRQLDGTRTVLDWFGARLRSDGLLGRWRLNQSVRKLGATRTQTTRTYTDPKTGLQVKCVSVTYSDFPTVEWTLFFKNNFRGGQRAGSLPLAGRDLRRHP